MRDEPKDETAQQDVEPVLEVQDTSEQEQDNVNEVTPTEEPEVTTETPTESVVEAPVEEPTSTLPSPNESPEDAVAPGVIASAPVVSAMDPSGVPPKKGKKALIIGLIAAGVAALLVGGSALAYNFWYQNPDKVVSDAIVNAITAKTVSATGTLEVESEDYTVKIEASAKNSIEANAHVAVKVTYAADGMSVTVDGEGIYSSDGDLYVKLNDAKELAASIEEQSDGQLSFEVFSGVIEKIDGNWIKIGKGDLGDFSEDYEKSRQCVADISKQLDEDSAFVRQVENEIQDLYKKNQFIIVGDKLGSRTINGQGSLGYSLSADPEIADTFFTEFANTEIGQRLKDCDESIDFSDIVSEDAKKDDGTETEAEIWVSRFGHYITEVNLKADEDGTKGNIVINPVFNKDEAIEIPANAIPLSELQADIEKAYEEYYASYDDEMYYDSVDMTDTTSTEI